MSIKEENILNAEKNFCGFFSVDFLKKKNGP